MKAIILCAGYATRLYPITLDKPKALLQVGGKPLLTYIIENLEKCDDVDKIFVVTNGKFYNDFVEWNNSITSDKNIKIINDNTDREETKLGGIGDLVFALEKENIEEDTLLILGDNLFDFELEKIIEFFKEKNSTVIGVYDIKDLEEAKRFGIVEAKDDKIIGFEEKPENPKSTLASVGIYVYTKEDLKKIKEYMNTDLPKDGPGYLLPYFLPLQEVHAFKLDGMWHDIENQETYKKVNDSWKK